MDWSPVQLIGKLATATLRFASQATLQSGQALLPSPSIHLQGLLHHTPLQLSQCVDRHACSWQLTWRVRSSSQEGEQIAQRQRIWQVTEPLPQLAAEPAMMAAPAAEAEALKELVSEREPGEWMEVRRSL